MGKFRCGKAPKKRWSVKCAPSTYFRPDPVKEQLLQNAERSENAKKKEDTSCYCLHPTLSKRVELTTKDTSIPPGFKYVVPKTRKQKKEAQERHDKYIEDLHFCPKDEFQELPIVRNHKKLEIQLQQPSAEIKEAKVFPRRPSVSPSATYPDKPNKKELSSREPRSGTIINATSVRKRTVIKRKKVRRVYEQSGPTIEELMARELATIQEMGEGEGEEFAPLQPVEESFLTKQFRKKVMQLSRSTSINSEDYKPKPEQGEGDGEIQEDPFIDKLVQKFRRESEIKRYQKPKRQIRPGTFENFSFTRLKQPTLKTFYYGVKLGTIDQNDAHFSSLSRNKQGICMPIAAYCFSILKHPDKWTTSDIDNLLESGNDLFLESANQQHLHGNDVHLKISDLQKYCKLGKKKVRFVVSEPEISGMIRSDDKKIYNLTKAINIFFGLYNAGILHTDILSVAIWKDKSFYFFDAGPRTIDLYNHPNGTALMANFYDTASVVSVLLNRSNLENRPFTIYSIEAHRVLSRDAVEVDSSGLIPEIDNFQVLNEEKAVALGSFDLADKCFGFSRNKQALTIAVVALVYSKITPPSSWHKTTIDKIVIIGNQLYLECTSTDTKNEIKVDDLPAIFTVGPYVVEVYLAPNRFVDFLYKKGKCVLHERFEKFFETNSNAVVEIDEFVLAVWKQRNIYHCLDPYSRNSEGLRCRSGTACVSMHTTLSSLIDTISKNFDHKDMIFHVHAMKVCKIHRDPTVNDLFPKTQTMNDYSVECFKKCRMRKSKRKATAKAVTVDPCTRAVLRDDYADGASIVAVGSTVRSVAMEDLPPMSKIPSSLIPKVTAPDKEFVADLDSASLSDTQIEPPPPEDLDQAVDFMDLDSFQLTQEEKDMHKRGEGEGEGKATKKSAEGEDAGEGKGSDEWYMAAAEFTQIGSQSLLSRLSAEVNTEPFTVEIPQEEVPVIARNIETLVLRKKKIIYDFDMSEEPECSKSEELRKETNFVDLPDGSQIILGGVNMSAFDKELEFMAPFVCIMAATVAKKYSIDSWNKDVVDYVVKCGAELYHNSNTRYDQSYKLEIPRISLGKTDFTIKVNYLIDNNVKHKVMVLAIGKFLFPTFFSGILVTPTYSCALFYKNHLYYLYDGFGSNEVGLSKGASNEGVACITRFEDLDSLVARILHNKTKREEEDNVEYNRFVLSSCYVKQLPKEVEEDDAEELQGGGGEDEPDVEIKEYKKSKEPKEEKPKKYGYHLVDNLYKIEGNNASGDDGVSNDLKEDYFVCLCACLMLLNHPIKKWDDRKVDDVVEQGQYVYSKMTDLDICSKKTIKNILIGDYLFDLNLERVSFFTFQARRTLKTGIETMLTKKHEHFILQFPNKSYALSVQGDIVHLFDPCDPNGKASWTRYSNFSKLLKRLRKAAKRGNESYNFHSFEVICITKAPKQVQIRNRSKSYRMRKGKEDEAIGKAFYEEISWLDVDPIPWSWRVNKTNLPKWHNWYVDIPDDLYSMFGSVSPLDERFAETRGKQTLGNLIVAIGMLQIYELADWNSHVLDNILPFGQNFFQECVKDISDENYEVAFEDINKECTIYPYSFWVKVNPVVEGTIFLVRLKQFNLYKALRLFFDDYEKRFGIVCVSRCDSDKRLYAFGKVQEGEYFLYDCETLGPPMYVDKNAGVSYILRTTTLNRLLHVMTLTLRGGDFCVFQVGLSELKSVN